MAGVACGMEWHEDIECLALYSLSFLRLMTMVMIMNVHEMQSCRRAWSDLAFRSLFRLVLLVLKCEMANSQRSRGQRQGRWLVPSSGG